jgi:polysaccharide export outer membrane protein
MHAVAGCDLRSSSSLGFIKKTGLRRGSLGSPTIFVFSAAFIGCMQLGLARGQSPAAETAAATTVLTGSQMVEAPPMATEGPGQDTYLLDIGDRIKVSIYGREDLTAEYRIQDDGRVRIPVLGRFSAAGRPAMQLEEAIRNVVEQTLHRQGFVFVDVIERRPIIVAGLVAKPGSYPYAPGMTVLHAAALAGGTLSSAAAPWLPTEALRESARLVTAKEELKRLFARQARLRAERDGLSEVAVPPELVDTAGADEAGQLIADEQAVYEQQLAGIARQQAALEISIREAKNEVAAYERELASIGEQRKVRQTSFDTVQSLSKRGLTTSQRLTDAELFLANIDRDAQQAIANIARSRQTVARSERDLALLMIDTKVRMEKELQAVAEQIAKGYAAMEGSAKIIHHAAGIPSVILTQDRNLQFRYEVLRKNGNGLLAAIVATETTSLQPGDVLRVSLMTSR